MYALQLTGTRLKSAARFQLAFITEGRSARRSFAFVGRYFPPFISSASGVSRLTTQLRWPRRCPDAGGTQMAKRSCPLCEHTVAAGSEHPLHRRHKEHVAAADVEDRVEGSAVQGAP